MAVATPSRESTELAAELMRVLEELSQDDQARFVESITAAIAEALDKQRYRIFADALQSWQHLVLAHRDPNYTTNMARGDDPLGPTYTVDEVRKQIQPHAG